MSSPVDEKEILEAIFEVLPADSTLTDLLDNYGFGSGKIRLADEEIDESNPSLIISLISDTPNPTNPVIHDLIIQFDATVRSVRVEQSGNPSDISNPHLHCLNIKRRLREILIGSRAEYRKVIKTNAGCFQFLEDNDIPIRKDLSRGSLWWIATMQYRVVYLR